MGAKARPSRDVDGYLLFTGATRGLGTSGVARVLHTSVWTVRRLMLDGKLQPDLPRSPGNHARYSLGAVASYMRANGRPVSRDLDYWLLEEQRIKGGDSHVRE